MLNKNTAENETPIKSTTSVDKANKIWSKVYKKNTPFRLQFSLKFQNFQFFNVDNMFESYQC